MIQKLCLFAALLLVASATRPATAETTVRPTKTEYVLWITFDGLRWQEVFGGGDERLMNADDGGVKNEKALRGRFHRDTAEARRRELLPFFWDVIARQGQLFGDPQHDAVVMVTNGRFFSYPGYQEILCGFPDERITSNAKIPNRNVTVLEWLHRRPGFDGQIAAYCSWDVFPFIINQQRSGIPVNAGWQPLDDAGGAGPTALLNELAVETPHYWDNVRYDIFTFYGAFRHLTRESPRLLYVAFGETDDWAHAGRYDLYLDSAQRTDGYVRRLWEATQAVPQMAGKTTLVITTDHGRGVTRDGWKNHGAHLPGSDQIWIAVLGPDTESLGIRKGIQTSQSQVAATVAALLDENYPADVNQAGAALEGAIRRSGSAAETR